MWWAPVAVMVAAIVVLFVRPARGAVWAGPLAVAAVGLIVGAVPVTVAREALVVLRDPLLFLALAVPLAAALDSIGVFEALAALVSGGRHLAFGLWVLAALVTIVLNLDAAVVLLTPLYIRIARLQSLPVEVLAFQPALLACLASHPLPVSNLTNLIVAEQTGFGTGSFLVHLGPPTVVSVAVGWWCYRRCFDVSGGIEALSVEPDRQALRRGLPIIGFVAIGFLIGDALHVPAWAVAAVALVWACLIGRTLGSLRKVPLEAVAIAAGLGVVVAAAVPHLGLDVLLEGTGVAGRIRALTVGGLLADTTNNLPAILATTPVAKPDQVWALLFAVNAAPAFVLTGALSSLLWRDAAASTGVQITPRRFTSVGLKVAGPAFVAGAAVLVFTP